MILNDFMPCPGCSTCFSAGREQSLIVLYTPDEYEIDNADLGKRAGALFLVVGCRDFARMPQTLSAALQNRDSMSIIITRARKDVTGLSAPGMPVVVSECVDQEQALRAGLDRLRDELKAAKGGPLGIRHVEEIQIGCSTDDHLSRWREFLRPIQPVGGVWHLSAPPHLRLVPADRDEITAIVLKVESFDRAVSQLKALDMLGETHEKTVAISESRTGGLKISLRE